MNTTEKIRAQRRQAQMFKMVVFTTLQLAALKLVFFNLDPKLLDGLAVVVVVVNMMLFRWQGRRQELNTDTPPPLTGAEKFYYHALWLLFGLGTGLSLLPLLFPEMNYGMRLFFSLALTLAFYSFRGLDDWAENDAPTDETQRKQP